MYEYLVNRKFKRQKNSSYFQPLLNKLTKTMLRLHKSVVYRHSCIKLVKTVKIHEDRKDKIVSETHKTCK